MLSFCSFPGVSSIGKNTIHQILLMLTIYWCKYIHTCLYTHAGHQKHYLNMLSTHPFNQIEAEINSPISLLPIEWENVFLQRCTVYRHLKSRHLKRVVLFVNKVRNELFKRRVKDIQIKLLRIARKYFNQIVQDKIMPDLFHTNVVTWNASFAYISTQYN